MSRPTIQQALQELDPPLPPLDRVRQAGGGRRAVRSHDPTRLAALEALVDPDTRGDPLAPVRWTCQRLRQVAAGGGRSAPGTGADG